MTAEVEGTDPLRATGDTTPGAGPSRRARPIAVAVAVGVVVVLLSGAVLLRNPGPDRTNGAAATDTTSTASPTTSTAPPVPPISLRAGPSMSVDAGDAGPVPDPIPEDPYADTPQVVLGQIEIPTLGVTGDLQEGITLTAINRGPGHWPGTPMPGGVGNMVVAGHRTTFTKPFNRINELVPGDLVMFHLPTGTVTYAVRGVIIVPAANIGIAAQTTAHTATLFACHPLNSATQRIVAKLALLGPDGRPVDAESDLPPIDAGSDPVTDTTLFVRDTSVRSAVAVDPLATADG